MASVLQIASPGATRRMQRVQTLTIAWMSVEAVVSLVAAWRGGSPHCLPSVETRYRTFFGGSGAVEISGKCRTRARGKAVFGEITKFLQSQLAGFLGRSPTATDAHGRVMRMVL